MWRSRSVASAYVAGLLPLCSSFLLLLGIRKVLPFLGSHSCAQDAERHRSVLHDSCLLCSMNRPETSTSTAVLNTMLLPCLGSGSCPFPVCDRPDRFPLPVLLHCTLEPVSLPWNLLFHQTLNVSFSTFPHVAAPNAVHVRACDAHPAGLRQASVSAACQLSPS